MEFRTENVEPHCGGEMGRMGKSCGTAKAAVRDAVDIVDHLLVVGDSDAMMLRGWKISTRRR